MSDNRWDVYWALLAIASTLSVLVHYETVRFAILAVLGFSLILRFTLLLLLRRLFTVDLLMGVSIIVASTHSLYSEAALIALLYSLAETMEVFVRKAAAKKIAGLKALVPAEVLVADNGSTRVVRADRVRPGDRVVVAPGDIVPVDGVLESEKAVFSTALITGEPEPRVVERGGSVKAGFVNKTSRAVLVVASRTVAESTLSLLALEAERALEAKTGLQSLLEKIAPWYTSIVLSAYGLIALIYSPVTGLPLLLTACPSAFIVSVSATTAYTVGVLASKGVVVKRPGALERITSTNTIVADKTGTLTTGRMELQALRVKRVRKSREEILWLARAVLERSRHPVAKSLAESLAKLDGYTARSEGNVVVEEVVGRGVRGFVDGVLVVAGSQSFVKETCGSSGNGFCGDGRVVVVSIDCEDYLIACLEEGIDGEAVRAVREASKELGAEIILFSGDSPERVRRVARLLGAKAYSSLSPIDKLRLIERLERSGKHAIVLGDGVNDAAALARATVGVAVGDIGVVAEAGDVVIDKAGKLSLLVAAGKAYREAVRTALAVAVSIKLAALVLGFSGLIPLWLVLGIGDDGSTIASSLAGILVVAEKLRSKTS